MIPLILVAMATVGCTSGPAVVDRAAPAEVQTRYTCGMHPQVVEDGPGTCPICGMDLTPMARASPSHDAHVVQVDVGLVQRAGVETEVVKHRSVVRHIRTLGEVEVGEDETSVVNLRFSGWVEGILVDKTGDEVAAGQGLFRIYSPELVAAQEEYLLALRAQGPDASLTQSARRKLELWNISDREIERLAKAGTTSRTTTIRAPRSGFVLHKNVMQGARVEAGQDLYRIGNLRRIWVTAEVYEHDAPWVEVDQAAQLHLTHLAGQPVEGKVAYVYPTLNDRSRTLRVRLEFDNPGVRLKPGMFATVYIQHRRAEDVVAVPKRAILHSGRRQLVFVSLGRGRFEPREVQTGLFGDDGLTQILHGIEPGEVVATSGQFLIDSESQLTEALRAIEGPAPHVHGDPP